MRARLCARAGALVTLDCVCPPCETVQARPASVAQASPLALSPGTSSRVQSQRQASPSAADAGRAYRHAGTREQPGAAGQVSNSRASRGAAGGVGSAGVPRLSATPVATPHAVETPQASPLLFSPATPVPQAAAAAGAAHLLHPATGPRAPSSGAGASRVSAMGQYRRGSSAYESAYGGTIAEEGAWPYNGGDVLGSASSARGRSPGRPHARSAGSAARGANSGHPKLFTSTVPRRSPRPANRSGSSDEMRASGANSPGAKSPGLMQRSLSWVEPMARGVGHVWREAWAKFPQPDSSSDTQARILKSQSRSLTREHESKLLACWRDFSSVSVK